MSPAEPLLLKAMRASPRFRGAVRALVLVCLGSGAASAQNLVINEVMSSNGSTLRDDAGEFPDWVEILNLGGEEVRLQGYGLSDSTDPLRWVFPDILLPSGARRIVFCSGRGTTEIPSHWETVIAGGDPWKYIVPASEPSPAWRLTGFDEAGWKTGPTGIGYGDGDDRTEVPAGTISVYARKTFQVSDPAEVLRVFLDLDFDDGFAAFLNGVEIARQNLANPGRPPLFNELATTFTEPRLVTGGALFPVRDEALRSLLRAGENVLAIQVHNVSSGSSDLSLIPFLTLGMTRPPEGARGPAAIIEPSLPGLHTDFKLSSGGETIALAAPDGTLLDSVATGYLPADVSLGRFPDGTGGFSYHSPATPGEPNSSAGYSSIGGAVTFSPEGVWHPGPIAVSLLRDDPSGALRYTTDGSVPTEASPQYAGPLQITSTKVVRARILGAGIYPGRIATRTFFIGQAPKLPIVSISTDPANFFDGEIGIYVTGPTYDPSFPYFGANFWEDWERPVHLELYERDGALGFGADAGAKIFGGWSRGNPQRSLSFFARGSYGAGDFDYRIFPEKDIGKYESFILRNSGNDWQVTHFRDALMTSLVKDLGIDRQAYRPSVVYINGQYWGILNLREKINEHFLAANHPGVSPDRIDLLEWNGSAIHGDADHYNAMLALLGQDVADPAVYAQVEAMVDIDNFIDYQASQIYFDNTDWPGNNIKYWRPRVEGGRWRWIIYDTDFGFGLWNGGNYANNTLAFALAPNGPDWPNPPWSTFLLRRLVTNRAFLERFVNRFATHLGTIFAPAKVTARINEMAAALEPEMPAQCARWGSNVSAWRTNVQVLRDFAGRRIPQVRSHLRSVFSLGAPGSMRIAVQPSGGGFVEVQGVPVRESPYNGSYFQGLPVHLAARPTPGYTFIGWTGIEPASEPEATVTVSAKLLDLTARFQLDCTAAGIVVLNEIQYNPAAGADSGDWVEIHNRANVGIDLGRWSLWDSSGGNGFIIPRGTFLAAGGYLVLVSDSTAFANIHPAVQNRLGDLGFSLDGGGESLRLYAASGELVDTVAYDDFAPWPTAADGGGATLALKNPILENSHAPHWAASPGGGTPGAPNQDVFVSLETECGPAFPRFLRGDLDGDLLITISDPVHLLLASFAGVPISCWSAGDADGDGHASGISDPIYLLGYLFLSGPAPAAPFPACGDPSLATDIALGCEAVESCR